MPQELVVCTGWHALCSIATDCRVKGETANCDCLQVDEMYIVMTNEIQDAAVKRQTLAKCTVGHPCDPDDAPVCRAIADGRYRVNGVRYDWVSTYSYRGWCGVLPKFEKDNIATRGSIPSSRAKFADRQEISARSSAVGSMFTVASVNRYTRFFTIII